MGVVYADTGISLAPAAKPEREQLPGKRFS
jgi:hypothetical protein